jgi:hypothetical protein
MFHPKVFTASRNFYISHAQGSKSNLALFGFYFRRRTEEDASIGNIHNQPIPAGYHYAPRCESKTFIQHLLPQDEDIAHRIEKSRPLQRLMILFTPQKDGGTSYPCMPLNYDHGEPNAGFHNQ